MCQICDDIFFPASLVGVDVNPHSVPAQILRDEAVGAATHIKTIAGHFGGGVIVPFRGQRGQPEAVFVKERECPQGEGEKIL